MGDDSGGLSESTNMSLFVNGEPHLIYFNVSLTTLLRGDVADILLEAFDDTNPQSSLTIDIQVNDTLGIWGHTYLVLPVFEEGQWHARFVPPLEAVIGSYDLRVRITEPGLGRQSPWQEIGTVEVLNNQPQILDFEIGNDTVERGLSIPVRFTVFDREDSQDHSNLTIQVSYTQLVFGILMHLEINLRPSLRQSSMLLWGCMVFLSVSRIQMGETAAGWNIMRCSQSQIASL